jgi:hypothetical protein
MAGKGKKKNYHSSRDGTKDSETRRGHISDDEVLSCYVIRSGYDELHYVQMDSDATRPGWTIMRAPGVTQIKTGDDVGDDTNALVLEALRGDIFIKAHKGRIIMEAENIQGIALGKNNKNGVISFEADEKFEVKAKNIEMNGSAVARFFCSGVLQVVGDGTLEMFAGLADCATGATKIKKSKYPSTVEIRENTRLA